MALFATKATFVRALSPAFGPCLRTELSCGSLPSGYSRSRSSMHLSPGSDTGTPATILMIGCGASASLFGARPRAFRFPDLLLSEVPLWSVTSRSRVFGRRLYGESRRSVAARRPQSPAFTASALFRSDSRFCVLTLRRADGLWATMFARRGREGLGERLPRDRRRD